MHGPEPPVRASLAHDLPVNRGGVAIDWGALWGVLAVNSEATPLASGVGRPLVVELNLVVTAFELDLGRIPARLEVTHDLLTI